MTTAHQNIAQYLCARYDANQNIDAGFTVGRMLFIKTHINTIIYRKCAQKMNEELVASIEYPVEMNGKARERHKF